ncbi:hypothetical protein FAP94_21465 [Morganella morganii]|nr:hypothetical protein [Morganella morganii]
MNNKFEIPHKDKFVDMSKQFDTYLVIGAGHALKVSDALQAGNFADDFGLYGFEEIDLAFRIINLGRVIKYNPNCIVYHKRSPDGRFSNHKVLELYLLNRCRMAKRYLYPKYFYSCLIVRSFHYLYNTKDFWGLFKLLKIINSDKIRQPFNKCFYNYISSVKGFLWY